MAPTPQVKQGWFHTAGRLGDRTLDQQLLGLDDLFANCVDKTVLDLGCAEGLISMELADRGAASVHGVEIVPGHIEVANKLKGKRPIKFEVADLNTWRPKKAYDIVIALALLHKLRQPAKACAEFARCARGAMVIRMPPASAPLIIDPRSHNEPQDISWVMDNAGFDLYRSNNYGPFAEWVGVWVRRP